MVKQIKPVSIIKVEGFGEYPAVEIVKQMGIKDQHDPKADEATKALYKKEFHGGVLKAELWTLRWKNRPRSKRHAYPRFPQAGCC